MCFFNWNLLADSENVISYWRVSKWRSEFNILSISNNHIVYEVCSKASAIILSTNTRACWNHSGAASSSAACDLAYKPQCTYDQLYCVQQCSNGRPLHALSHILSVLHNRLSTDTHSESTIYHGTVRVELPCQARPCAHDWRRPLCSKTLRRCSRPAWQTNVSACIQSAEVEW